MPINAICTCGAAYTLKDEFAGQIVECTKCGQPIQVPHLSEEEAPPIVMDEVFARDQFLLRQKHLSISAKYYVWDERGNALLFVERPAHLLRNLGATACGIFAGIITGFVLAVLTRLILGPDLNQVGAVISVIGAFAVLFVVAAALSAKRHVNFYRDDSKRELLLRVFQDQNAREPVNTERNTARF